MIFIFRKKNLKICETWFYSQNFYEIKRKEIIFFTQIYGKKLSFKCILIFRGRIYENCTFESLAIEETEIFYGDDANYVYVETRIDENTKRRYFLIGAIIKEEDSHYTISGVTPYTFTTG